MSKTISQETFNEVVRESMDEFDMTEEEAVAEAVQQFKAQGVNLSTIMKNTSNSEAIINRTKRLKELLQDNKLSDNESIIILNNLECLVKEDIAAKLLAAKEGLYPLLMDILEQNQSDQINVATVETLRSLLDGYPDLLDSRGITKLLEYTSEKTSLSLLLASLRLLVICVTKHEKTRSALIRGGIATQLRSLVDVHRSSNDVVAAVCNAVQVLILDDDVRVVHGDAHEHARSLAEELLPLLISILPDFSEDPKVTYDLLEALTSLLVRNEFCILFHEQKGLKSVMDAMVDHPDNENVVRACLLILKALAGSDEVKTPIISAGAAPLIVAALNKHFKSSGVALAGCTCIGALSLRSPSNSLELAGAGAPEVIVRTLTHWKNNKIIMKNGCSAIRNQVSRCPDLRAEYKELQVDELLREVKDLKGDLDFEAKQILLDLDCDVQLKEEWKGQGVQLTN